MATPERIRMSVEEFKQLPESNQLTELIDGELIVSPAPKDDHQKLILPIGSYLRQIVSVGEVRVAPTDVWLGEDCVQPDIFWVSGPESKCKLGGDGYWYGAPDLIVEVLSPSTAYRDRGAKFNLYQQHGVREYWLADPDGEYFEVYVLENGMFIRKGAFGKGDAFVSLVLSGVTVTVCALFNG
jgi:Uma2 family endonuclease